MVHFILDRVSHLGKAMGRAGSLYLDIREIGLDNAIHDTPYVGYRVLVRDSYLQLIPDKGPCAFTTKQILGPHTLTHRAVHVLELDLHGVLRISLLVDAEPLDCPRPLHMRVVLLQVGNEDALNEALVQKGGEGISRIDETGTARPSPCPSDTLSIPRRIPKRHFVYPCWLLRHNRRLQPHIPEQVQRTGLYTIGTTCWCWFCSVVDVLDLIAPPCQACREHEPYRPGPDNYCNTRNIRKRLSKSRFDVDLPMS